MQDVTAEKAAVVYYLVKRHIRQRFRPAQQKYSLLGFVPRENYRLQIPLEFFRQLVQRGFRLKFFLQVASCRERKFLVDVFPLVQVEIVDGGFVRLQNFQRFERGVRR